MLRTALTHAVAGFGPDDPHVAAAKQNLAEVLRISASDADDARLQEALELYKDALGVLVSTYGYADVRVGALLHNMAGVYVRMEDWEEAERCYEEALDVKTRVFGGGDGGNGGDGGHGSDDGATGTMRHRDVELTARHLEAVRAKRRGVPASGSP